jgi:membrane-anchored protein YejM (alkaline phosphatase superfamily)
LLGLIVVLLVFIDLQLFKLYEYHINAFVWNLVTTPGGLAALGASQETINLPSSSWSLSQRLCWPFSCCCCIARRPNRLPNRDVPRRAWLQAWPRSCS